METSVLKSNFNFRITARYTIILSFLCLGSSFCGYLTVFLQECGFSSETIGTINALCAVAAILGDVMAGRISDNLRTVKWTAFVIILIASALTILLPFSARMVMFGVPVALVLTPFWKLFISPASDLTDNCVVRCSYSEKFNYGTARAFGYVFAVVGSFLSTALFEVLSNGKSTAYAVQWIFILCGLGFLATGSSVLWSKDPINSQELRTGKKARQFRVLFHNRAYVFLALYYFMVCFAINPPYVFMSYILKDSNIAASWLGVILGVEYLVGVPALLSFGFLRRRFSFRTLLIAITVVFTIAFYLQSVGDTMPVLILSAVFFGVANSLLVICANNYIYFLAPPELKATAQTVYIAFGSVGVVTGNLAAGYIVSSCGIRTTYLLFAVLTAVAGFLYAITVRWERAK